MPTSVQYESGNARNEALSEAALDLTPPELPSDLPEDPALFQLSEDQYWEWLSVLVDEGSVIDQELDHLLDDVYECQSSFYSLSGHRRLRTLLQELHEVRASIRAYEHDVEELTYVFARSEAIETKAGENAEMTLAKIKATYDRAYDLCLYKLDRMSNGWITASNFLISVVMLVVTILFWMEFR